MLNSRSIKPPTTPQRPHQIVWQTEVQEHLLQDPYHWLRAKDDPAVAAYLQEEQAYTETVLAGQAVLRDEIYQEIKSRIIETDQSVPVHIDDYWYYTRTEAGLEYPIYCRRQETMAATEEILLDQNALAAGQDYCDVGMLAVSPDHRYLVYGLDTTGDEVYTIYIKDLSVSTVVVTSITNAAPTLVWTNDSRGFYYVTLGRAQRPDTVCYYTLHDPEVHTEAVLHETDPGFYVTLGKTKDKAYILIEVSSGTTNEVWYMSADRCAAGAECVWKRREDIEYFLEHHSGTWYVLINDTDPNFRLLTIPVGTLDPTEGEEIMAARSEVVLEGIELFAEYLCVFEMREGITGLRVCNVCERVWREVVFPEPVYQLGIGANPNFTSQDLRLHYSSPVTPNTTYACDLRTGDLLILKQQIVPNYQPVDYIVERQHVVAPDGEQIPVTIVRPQQLTQPGPCVCTGYGAYGVVETTGFSISILSLLQRGFVYAVAHVRGGGEKGRRWFEAGRLLQKQNSFTDFIAVTE